MSPSALTGTQWFPAKGLNTAQPAHRVPMDMASAGFDFVVDENEVLKKRDGYAQVNSTEVSASPSITSLSSLYLSSGTKYELLGTSNGSVYQESAGVVTAQVFSGLQTTYPLDYTQFLDSVIVLDGSSSPYTWDGSATGTISAAPSSARYGETHLNKFFLTGIAGNLSRVDYSATGDFNTYTGAGTDQFQVEQNNGQITTGIKSFSGNELVIFKERSMFKLLGVDKPSFTLSSIDLTIGCISNRTIQVFKSSTQGGILVFASQDGIYVYDGVTPRKISSYIQDFWDSINRTKYDIFDSTIDFDKGRYLLSVATGSDSINSRIISVDLLHPWEDENGLHFPITLWRVSAQSLNTEFVSSTNAQRLVFGGSSDGLKYYFGTLYSDNGDSIESYVVTPLMKFEDGLGQENCLRRIYSAWVTTAGSITVSSENKDGTEWVEEEIIQAVGAGAAIGVDFQIGISAIGVPEASFTARTNTQVRSRRIKIRFLQDSATRYFNLQSPVEFYYKRGGLRN